MAYILFEGYMPKDDLQWLKLGATLHPLKTKSHMKYCSK
jgi:hypothetical protein